MTQRISSPEELNRRMKINRVGIWIVLTLLTVAVIVGMILFLSGKIVMRETHLCYVTDVSMPSIDALYEVFLSDPIYRTSVTKDALKAVYGDTLRPYSQFTYFLIEDLEETEMAEGMKFYIGDNWGYVISIPNKPTKYEDILRLGFGEKEMRKAGLTPGIPYYLMIAFLSAEEPAPILTDGFYTADVVLDTVDPISFILK